MAGDKLWGCGIEKTSTLQITVLWVYKTLGAVPASHYPESERM
jgi:hypothetical protein